MNKLKEASYLCAPQIAAYNAQRERAWAQKVLGGASYEEKRRFVEGGWNDIANQMKSIDGAHDLDSGDKRILACEAVAGSKIRNHTCVLAPESTEGPYFHVSQQRRCFARRSSRFGSLAGRRTSHPIEPRRT